MTGYEMLKRTLNLLGYNSEQFITGNAYKKILERSVDIINSVYSDLFYANNNSGFAPIVSVEDEIVLPERILNDVMPYGVATKIAMSENDGDQQQIFAQMYNTKRLKTAENREIEDTIPCPS